METLDGLEETTMTVEEIRTLLVYNAWANRRLLAAARPLSAGEFTRDLQSSHSSVRGTLVHLIGGHWVWLRLWLGEGTTEIVARCGALWDPQNFPDVTSLEAAHDEIDLEQTAFIDSVTDERLNTPMRFQSFQGEERELSLSQMIQHVVNHSTYHRGQVVTLLRQHGQVPPGTDLSTFLVQGATARAPE